MLSRRRLNVGTLRRRKCLRMLSRRRMNVGTLRRRRFCVLSRRRMNVGTLRRRRLCVLRRRLLPSRSFRVCGLGRLLVVLLRDRFARLVVVALRPDCLLLLRSARIAGTRVLALVHGLGRRWRDIMPVPAVPSSAVCFPALAPVLAPARRRVGLPTAEIDRRLAVVANWNTQHKQRHGLGPNHLPGAVVPAARIPGVSGVNPVETVVEEVIRVQLRVVIDRIAGNLDQRRIGVDVDGDAYLSLGRGREEGE